MADLSLVGADPVTRPGHCVLVFNYALLYGGNWDCQAGGVWEKCGLKNQSWIGRETRAVIVAIESCSKSPLKNSGRIAASIFLNASFSRSKT